MSTLKTQTDAQINQTRQKNPGFMAKVDALVEQSQQAGEGKNALPVGSQAPQFALPDATGEIVQLETLLAQGAVVVTFYRGGWCPYCNLELKALQDQLDTIHSLGAELVAISPQMPDESLSQTEKTGLSFPVLSDQDAEVAKQFGVAWEVPEVLLTHMKEDRKLDLVNINNGNGTVLPIPATFVLNQQGDVVWLFADVDYRRRAEPEEILAALKELA